MKITKMIHNLLYDKIKQKGYNLMTKNISRSSIKGLDDYEKQVNDRREFEEFRSSITHCDFSKKNNQNVVCEEQNEENLNIGEEITDNDIKILQSTLKSLQEKVMILENSWNQTQKEFKITEIGRAHV